LAYGIDLGEEPDWFDLADQLLGEDHGWDIDRDKAEIVAGLGLEIDTHCSGDYPMYIVHAPGTNRCANRGYPQKIDPASTFMEVSQELRLALKRVAKAAGIEAEPAWLLYSMWC